MDSGMMGPDWEWQLLGALAVAGALALIVAIGCGIYWLVCHVRFV